MKKEVWRKKKYDCAGNRISSYKCWVLSVGSRRNLIKTLCLLHLKRIRHQIFSANQTKNGYVIVFVQDTQSSKNLV